ncbi:oxidoreductase [Iodidimonas gelatinilytica]|uniref:Oxidoreductase n=1 Tax=Iodidimonas gelatinilytica TaxID=1236966 RepID=A0A5A7MMG3_9PROT|nr:Gfo/Idh/MocA family oxidoreductase [Iodidimonas gelatinilytica]GEQ96393.1 oxidoreductase [Iodidimonas gelatinilytica]
MTDTAQTQTQGPGQDPAQDRVLRIGLLGAARITPRAIIVPSALHGDIDLMAVAARDRAKAEAFAEEHGVLTVADGYEALVTHPEVDLVYNALPPSSHAHWCIKAMEAGKDVLCEKPFAMTADEAQAMVATARRKGKRVIEAFHYRYHPMFSMLMALVASGRLGALEHISASLGSPISENPRELRRIKALGGGVLMDMGCYTMHWCRTLTGHEPSNIAAEAHISGEVDDALGAEFMCGNVACAMTVRMDPDADRGSELLIEGSEGRILVRNPLAPDRGNSYLLETLTGSEEGEINGPTTMECQLMAVKRALYEGTPLPTEGADSINNMRALDQVRAAANLC